MQWTEELVDQGRKNVHGGCTGNMMVTMMRMMTMATRMMIKMIIRMRWMIMR